MKKNSEGFGWFFKSWIWKLKFNLKAYLSTAALPGQITKTALTEEFMFQNVAYRPTVYITGHPPRTKLQKNTPKKLYS